MMMISRLLVIIALAIGSSRCQNEPKLLQWQVPVTKCCTDEEFYTLGFDSCIHGDMPTFWPPPVYALRTNKTVEPDRLQFSTVYNLSVCPQGYDSVSTKEFHLYTDGTAKVNGGTTLQPGDFCLNEIVAETLEQPEYAVRYCIPDPCNQTNCVHKCCPSGMSLNETSRLCQTTADPFQLVFNDATGQVVTPDPESYIIRYGDVPICPFGMFPLMPDVAPEEKFYILPDGQMYVVEYPETERTFKEYCIEDFITGDGSIARQALICFPPQPEESADNQLVLKVFPYFLFVSSLFLIATFLVYALIPEIRNIHGVTIMCHVASLAVTYIGLGIIQLNALLPDGLCVGLAVVVHFAFLSTFTWLNVMSFDIWWTFSPLNKSTIGKSLAATFWMETLSIRTVDRRRCQSSGDGQDEDHSDRSDLILSRDLRPRNSRRGRQHLGRRIIFYSIYAWGVPFVIVLVGQILDHVNVASHVVKPNFGVVKCWFSEKNALLAYLYGPIAVLILSNIVFFVMTAILLYRASIDTAFAANSAHAKQKFRVIFSLFILMGVSWMMEVISFAVGGSAYIWIPTDILNILTGVFIFIIFVCKPNVWKLLKVKCPCLEQLDSCCPSFMLRSNTRQGTTTRSTRNDLSVNKSLSAPGIVGPNNRNDSKKNNRISSTVTLTQSTQLRDSTHVDSEDEIILDQESNNIRND